MLVNLTGDVHVVLKTMPGHLARRFHQVSTVLFDLEMRKAGISLTAVQYAALITIRDNPKIDQATLAGLIAYDRTTIGGVVDRLVEKGFVTRVSSDIDRRAKLLSVSEAGLDIIAQTTPMVEACQSRLVAALSPEEQAQLTTLLGKVITDLGDISRSSR
jgi:DNA-binding MarR family transcriptional regulator